VVEVNPSPEPELVRLLGPVPGPPGSALHRMTRPLLALAVGLGSRPGIDVASIGPADAELALVLVGGARVRVGPVDSLEPKLYALEAMLAREVPRCLDTIDVRVPTAPVLTRKPGCA
ncbi:MAG: hypothetical protein WKF43_12260, partial [Acidimicrobiales bacterium]